MFYQHRPLLSLLTLFLLSTTQAFRTPHKTQPRHRHPTALSARIAIAGATGRTGQHVVTQLLSQNIPVYALVRNPEKAVELFGTTSTKDENLIVRKTDLGSEEDVMRAMEEVEDCEAVIWCATGFSDAPDQSFWTKIQAMLGLATKPKQTIDAVGLPALAKAISTKGPRIQPPTESSPGGPLPRIIMLSSAGVTRPNWSEEKKKELEGSAGIPIVRLNPFGILGVKEESEEELRRCGVDYTIFRPCGLNDSWPTNSRPIFSQGDIAVGRINRMDVAQILIDLLSTPEATGKTFEAITLADSVGYYPPAESMGVALGRLRKDSEGMPSEEVVKATYAVMQQLLPGEKQDASRLAMGQTYEQLDKGEVGRLGEKGKEDVAGAGLTPSS